MTVLKNMVQTCTEELTAKELKSGSATTRTPDGQPAWFSSPYYRFLTTLGRKLEEGRAYEVGRRVEGEKEDAELISGIVNRNARKLSFHYSDDNEDNQAGRDPLSRKRKASTD